MPKRSSSFTKAYTVVIFKIIQVEDYFFSISNTFSILSAVQHA